MKDSHILINQINEHKHDDLFADIYVDANKIEYQKAMNEIFGESACSILKIRKYGGMKVF
ncbi:MAG: hypothetical protein IJD40_05785 [Lachnospiraceae bacterium]|nr:hypothetical protein [Lachnospiraceae bacterium]